MLFAIGIAMLLTLPYVVDQLIAIYDVIRMTLEPLGAPFHGWPYAYDPYILTAIGLGITGLVVGLIFWIANSLRGEGGEGE